MPSNLNTIHYLFFLNVLLKFSCQSFTHHYLFASLYFLWNVQWTYAKIESLSLIRLPSSWSIFCLFKPKQLFYYFFVFFTLLISAFIIIGTLLCFPSFFPCHLFCGRCLIHLYLLFLTYWYNRAKFIFELCIKHIIPFDILWLHYFIYSKQLCIFLWPKSYLM